MVSTAAAAAVAAAGTRVGPGCCGVGTRTIREAGAGEAEARAWEGRGGGTGGARLAKGAARPGVAPRPSGQRACEEDPASRPVTRSARCGPGRPQAVRVVGRASPASPGLAGDGRPRCRTTRDRCTGHSGPGPQKGPLVSCDCCDPLERTRGDSLKSEGFSFHSLYQAFPPTPLRLLPHDLCGIKPGEQTRPSN